MGLSSDEGEAAVRLAREALEARLKQGPEPRLKRLPSVFSQKRGVFVTLNSASSSGERLRGCIGFPYPVKELSEAIVEAAVMAATEDPRFEPVTGAELGDVLVEVSVLTLPRAMEAVRRRDYPSQVRVGSDGLIVSNSFTSGLLLPQVATEFKLGPAEFLSQACMKAGLSPDAWLDEGVSVQTFQAEVFAESHPKGTVHRVQLRESQG